MQLIFFLFISILLPVQTGLAADFSSDNPRALLVPEAQSTLSSQIDAEIIAIHRKEGDSFQEGDLLISFDCSLIQAQLQKARLDLEAAAETFEANRQLRQYGSVSQLEVALSASRHKRAQAEVGLHETLATKCEIRAPFAGTVVKWQANPFETVGKGTPLLEIIDNHRLNIHIIIPSLWLTDLKIGAPLRVTIDETGKTYKAELTGFGAKINPVNQTVEAFAAFTSPHPKLLAGMSGSVSFGKE